MSDHSITSLIEKLEQAEVGSTKLDCYVGLRASPDGKGAIVIVGDKYVIRDAGGTYAAAPVTTSLDAALALAKRVVGEEAALSILQDTVDGWNAAAGLSLGNLPRLLCAAILRAQSEARV